MAVFNSIFSVVAIALDRHNAIVRPLKGTFTNQRALRYVALIWIMGFVYSFPKYVVATVRHYQTKAMMNISDQEVLDHCMFGQEVALGLNFLDVVVVYLLPLGTVTLLYSRAVRVLRQCDHNNTPHLQVLNGRRRRAIKMIIIITIMFGISWLPYHVLSIVSHDPFRGMSSVMTENLSKDFDERQTVRNETTVLMNKMITLDIAFMTVFWYYIIRRFDAIGAKLQEKSFDLSTAIRLISSLKEYVNLLCEEFNRIEIKTHQLSNIVEEQLRNEISRKRKIKLENHETSEGEISLSGIQKFHGENIYIDS
ncbi:tachykinin-like peptides receptor 99D [Limulus polyphemus]|uniref:Tachykinin-like peptides receptor 99D n=1 Tax=Limulus polyphemus TaxID=6850 RepID=A0ABM1B2D9_LIMPO|nr:tachykinin-like peptides receptor 99D [Limulus polyphemus]